MNRKQVISLLQPVFEDLEEHLADYLCDVVASYVSLLEVEVWDQENYPISDVGVVYTVRDQPNLSFEILADQPLSAVGNLKIYQLPDDLKLFIKYFNQDPPIRNLSFARRAIATQEQVCALQKALAGNNGLNEITLEDNFLGNIASPLLNVLFSEVHGLSKLNLSMCFIDDNGAKAIADALLKNHGIRELDLSFNGIRGDGIAALAECFAFHRGLRVVSLEGNDASGTEVGLALAKIVRTSSNLRRLNIGTMNLTSSTVSALGHSLQHSSSLLELNLSGTSLKQDALPTFLKGLKHSEIISLDLSRCGVTLDLIGSILSNISPKLTSLKLNHNPLGDESMESLSTALCANKTLKYLELIAIELTMDGTGEIGAHLPDFNILSLDLSDNYVGFASRWRLRKAQPSSLNLVMVNCV